MRFGVFLHTVEFFGVDIFLAAFVHEAAEGYDVLEVIEQHRFGREAVAARAPDFLVKVLDAFGQVVVNHVADIALVDSHAECDGRAHDIDAVVDKVLLHGVAFVGAHSCVVRLGRNSSIHKLFRDLFGVLSRKAVDDSRFVFMLRDNGENSFQLVLPRVAASYVQT